MRRIRLKRSKRGGCPRALPLHNLHANSDSSPREKVVKVVRENCEFLASPCCVIRFWELHLWLGVLPPRPKGNALFIPQHPSIAIFLDLPGNNDI